MKPSTPSDNPSASANRPTLVEWIQALADLEGDSFRLAPHHVQLLEFLEGFVASDPPRRLIICAPPSRLPLRGRIE